MDLARRRLAAQRLAGEPFTSPVQAVRALGAVQSQDYAAARWALAQRTGASGAEIDRLFDEGKILRSHVLRPTWHFVVPEDLDGWLRLSAPRIREGFLRSRHRQLGLDEETVRRALEAFESALGEGAALTRAELATVLARAEVAPDGQRLPHLLLAGELERVLTSGPRRGKQFTWTLLDARAPRLRHFDADEVGAGLAERYFRSHGPAQVDDFRWWSGLTATAARRALDAARPGLAEEEAGGKRYWFDPGAPPPPAGLTAHLLANFDEYLVAYSDRSAALVPGLEYDPSFFSFGSILGNVALVDGRVRGGWRKTARGGVEVRLLDEPRPAEQQAIDAATAAARAFFAPR